MQPHLYKRYVKIKASWKKFKKLRSHPENYSVDHPDFLTVTKRENAIEDLLAIIDLSISKKI